MDDYNFFKINFFVIKIFHPNFSSHFVRERKIPFCFERKMKAYSHYIVEKPSENFSEKKENLHYFIIVFRLIFNFFQINSLFKDLHLPWQPYLLNLFNIQYYFSNPFKLLFFFDCVISSNFLYFFQMNYCLSLIL